MSEIILHHYQTSPFARKMRVLMGFKNIHWQSVIIPAVMPKPDVVALTGGYRRTPIMQVGADIFCDTALIGWQLDQYYPNPPLYPTQHAATVRAWEQWADTALFQNAVGLVFQKEVLLKMFNGDMETMQKFAGDRAAMSKGAPRRKISVEEARTFLHNFLADLEQQLEQAGPYLLGDTASMADIAVYHPLWFIQTKPIVNKELQDYPQVLQWMQRVDEWGEGESTEISSDEALQVANRSEFASLPKDSCLADIAVGSAVSVTPGDYAFDSVVGELQYCDNRQIALARRDERAGDVVVHFPRIGYDIIQPE